MNAAGKVIIGTAIAGGMIGLAILLGKPKAPPMERVGRPGSGNIVLPFRMLPEATGDVLEITDLGKMVPWMVARAKELRINDFASARAALEQIGKSVTGKKILSVVMTQLPQIDAIPWADALALANNLPWRAVLPIAKQWIKAQGIA